MPVSTPRARAANLLLCGGCLLLLWTGPARAAPVPSPADPFAGLDHTGTPTKPPRTDRLPPQSAKSGKKRRPPDYDGRKSARLSAGEVLIWVPRVIFYPVYLTLEYLIRWPIVNLIAVLEKYHVIEAARRFFTFADGKGLLMPTILADIGRFNTVGFHFRYRDFGFRGHTLMVKAGFWANDWADAAVVDSFKIFRRDQGTVTTRVEFKWRPDNVFHGLGPDSPQEARSFYRVTQTDVFLGLGTVLGNLNRLHVALTYRNVRLEGGQSPSIASPERAEYWDVNDPAHVPGFGTTYNLLSLRAKLNLDSRNPRQVDTPGTGVRLEAFGSFSLDPGNTRLHFAHWGGELAGFWDVSGRNHVLSLRLHIHVQEQTGRDPVPIHERIALGDSERLRGFVAGRFRGDSAFVLSAQYRYPIWWALDANLFVSVGNVFTGRFDDFSYRKLVMSWGIGLRTNTARDVSFDVLVAFGTNPFRYWADDFELSHIRLLFGVNQGF